VGKNISEEEDYKAGIAVPDGGVQKSIIWHYLFFTLILRKLISLSIILLICKIS
jgi:hypothetical protein